MRSPGFLVVLFLIVAIGSFAQEKAQLVVTTGKHRLMPNGTLSPDGKFILTDDCITGKIWDVKSGKFLMQLNADRELEIGSRFLPMYSFEFLPDGRVAQWGDDVIKIYDIRKQGAVTEIKLPEEYIDTDWQNTELVVATWDDPNINIRNLSTGKVFYKLRANEPRRPAHLDVARGKLIDFSGKVFDFKKGKVVKLQGVDRMNDYQGMFMFAPAGDVIICRPVDGGDNMADNAITGRVYFWDAISGKLLDSLAGQNFRPQFSPDGKLLVTIAGHPDTWNDQLEYEMLHEVSGGEPAYIKQQDEFKWDSTASIWDVRTRKRVRVLKGHTSTLTGARFSPDGALVTTSAIDSTARVFDAATGKLKFVFRGHDSGAVELCGFGQGGKLLITTSWDRTCKVWDTQTGKLIYTLKPFAMETAMVVADKKGDRFVSVDKTRYPGRPMGGCDYCENLNGKLWESSSGREVRGLQFKEKPLPAFSPDGKALIGRFLNDDLRDGIIEMSEGTRKFVKDYSPVFSRKGNVGFALAGDSLKVWRADNEKPVLVLRVTPSTPPLLSESEDYVQAADLSNELGIWSIANKSRILSLGAAGAIEKMEFSEDGKRFMTITKDKLLKVWDLAAKKVVIDWRLKKDIYQKDVSLSATGKYILTVGNREQHLLDAHGDTIVTVEGSRRGSNIFAATDDAYFILDTEGKKQEIFDPVTRKITKAINVESSADRLFLTSRNVMFISNLADGHVRLWDITTGKIVDPLFHVPAGISSLDFSGDRNTLFVTAMDGSISILRGAKFDQHLLTLYPVGESDWVVTHPSGLFDATPGAVDKLYFIQGFDVIQFDQLKDRYYEPGLWKKVMSGEPLRNVVGFKSIDLPPDIEVGQVDGEGYLTIQFTNRGGGIGEVNVFMNGKEVIKDARDASVNPDAANASLKIFVGKHKSIIKGQENFIGVKVWNKDHWVQSKGQVVFYQSKEIEKYKPAVHLLTVGVSDYTGTEIDLKYAAKDANDMSVALQLGAKKLFGADRSYVYNLTTTQPKEFYPTKTNILKAFEKIASTAHPLDIFVMYVSGHGINYGGQDGDWHYLTQEAYTGSASAYSDPAIRAQTTISSNELVELFKKVPALKQVLMLDACASGKVVDNLMAQKDIESSTIRALDRMRDRTGMHIITGCAADAVSYEASKYGQGVLTYSLLEGIRGAALREDQFVDVNKLFQYAQERVPQLAGGIGGIQSPQVFSPQGSQSFDIGLLTTTEKTAIPIARIRPVYIRSNFQDENEMEDVLNIGKAIDESLNEASAKGVDASIIFVDVRDYPDACKLSGRYKKEGGQIVLKLRKKCGAEDQTFEIKAPNLEALKAEVLKKL